MPATITSVNNSIDPKALTSLLNRDGGAIVESALNSETLHQLNQEFDEYVLQAGPGLRHPANDFFVDFYGAKTVRIDGLAAKSRTFWHLLELNWLTGIADELLLPSCEDYLLNTAQLIEIGPGETAQTLHRDEEAWRYFKAPKPLLQVEAMFALSDFTLENGATQVVPGSHRWDEHRKPNEHEIAFAQMSAGSALVYLGTTLHGGGANITVDQKRRGVFVGFVLGWLRTEENTFLSVPIEKVREMPPRCQELLGYKPHEGIGVVDVGSPLGLVR